MNLKVLTDVEVADKIVAMTKTKYGVQIERSGKFPKKACHLDITIFSVELATEDCDTTVEMEGDSDSGQDPEEDGKVVECEARDGGPGQLTKENQAAGSSGENQ